MALLTCFIQAMCNYSNARLGADVFVMGDDWAGKFDFVADHCNVVYLARTPGVSSTEIKQRMRVQRPADMHA